MLALWSTSTKTFEQDSQRFQRGVLSTVAVLYYGLCNQSISSEGVSRTVDVA